MCFCSVGTNMGRHHLCGVCAHGFESYSNTHCRILLASYITAAAKNGHKLSDGCTLIHPKCIHKLNAPCRPTCCCKAKDPSLTQHAIQPQQQQQPQPKLKWTSTTSTCTNEPFILHALGNFNVGVNNNTQQVHNINIIVHTNAKHLMLHVHVC